MGLYLKQRNVRSANDLSEQPAIFREGREVSAIGGPEQQRDRREHRDGHRLPHPPLLDGLHVARR